jgi:uncharacterized protein YndB with AHSA1/START domain
LSASRIYANAGHLRNVFRRPRASRASADQVYAAVATAAGHRQWWTADTRMEESVGGNAEFGFDNGQMVFRMTIEKLDPSRCVIMSCHGDQPEWNGTTLTWDIIKNAAADGVTLRFTHSGWREVTDFCTSCNSSAIRTSPYL